MGCLCQHKCLKPKQLIYLVYLLSYRFTKCWEVKNNGRIAWPPGCTLQYNGGDFISVFTSLPTTTLEPGCTMTLSTDFVTPSKPGSYQSKWRMMLPTGTYFGGMFCFCFNKIYYSPCTFNFNFLLIYFLCNVVNKIT